MKYNSGRIDLVKHKINDHSGDAHVQPDRESDSRDTPVTHKVVTKRAVESKKHERNDHDRENRVACEYREVDRANNAGSLETCSAVVEVVREIRRQKQQ